jgi:hypothetical protein
MLDAQDADCHAHLQSYCIKPTPAKTYCQPHLLSHTASLQYNKRRAQPPALTSRCSELSHCQLPAIACCAAAGALCSQHTHHGATAAAAADSPNALLFTAAHHTATATYYAMTAAAAASHTCQPIKAAATAANPTAAARPSHLLQHHPVHWEQHININTRPASQPPRHLIHNCHCHISSGSSSAAVSVCNAHEGLLQLPGLFTGLCDEAQQRVKAG